MKNLINKVLGLCLFLLVISCKQEANKSKNESYQLEGQIAGLVNGTVVELVPGATHSREPAVAETALTDGKFSFSGKLKEPRFFYIMFSNNKGVIPVMLENSNIRITATGTVSDSENGRISFKDKVVEGSESQDYYLKETAFRNELNKDYQDYHKGTEELVKIYAKARVDGNKKIMDSIGNMPEYKSFEQKEKAFFDKVKLTSENLIAKHKDSWWGPFFMLTQYSYFTPEQKPVFEQFSEAAKNSYYGKVAREELYPKSLIGTNVANFSLKDKDGKSFKAKDIISGKKYILIDFWASWCAPCRKEIPNLNEAYENYSDKGFEILSISIDKDEKAWHKALGQESMPWPNLYDDGKVSNSFKVKAIPATFLVDENGVVVEDNLRGKALEEKLAELLKS
ncbi:redoxin domain-containing protein [Mariniflexile sp. HMF6888]|uniref:redoxin domain-containing protein n=1 Tax=Mariniflexile sp. HMF6888 TaxID=3373086 RepID=UPI00379AB4E2